MPTFQQKRFKCHVCGTERNKTVITNKSNALIGLRCNSCNRKYDLGDWIEIPLEGEVEITCNLCKIGKRFVNKNTNPNWWIECPNCDGRLPFIEWLQAEDIPVEYILEVRRPGSLEQSYKAEGISPMDCLKAFTEYLSHKSEFEEGYIMTLHQKAKS